MVEQTGGCACGAVRWHHSGPGIRNLVCHCDSCRRAISSACAAFLGTRERDVAWQGRITRFASSPEADRGFCGACGTRLYFRSTRWPGELHLHVGSMDDPTAYRPDTHVVVAEAVPWSGLADDLERQEGFSRSPSGGGADD